MTDSSDNSSKGPSADSWLGNIRNRIRAALHGRPFFKSVALVAGGAAVAQSISVLSTPVLTRLYDVSHFGVLTVFVSLLGVIQPLATLRYAVTIPIAEDDDFSYDVLRLCFFVTSMLSFMVLLGVLFFGDMISVWYPDNDIGAYLWLLPICFFGIGIYQSLASWTVRNKKFKLLARTRVRQGVFSSAVKIGFGLLGFKPVGLLLGHVISSAAGTGSVLLALLRERPSFFREGSWRRVCSAARRFARFPLLQSWSQLFLSLGMQLPALFVAAIYGAEPAGYFGLAFSMVSMPMNILGQSVSQVYFSEVAQYGKSQPKKILRLSVSLVKKLFLIGAGPLLAIAVLGPLLFSFVFGDAWSEAGMYARYLSLFMLSRFVASPISHCLNVLEAQWVQIAVNFFRVLVPVSVFLACKHLGVEARDAILFYCLAAAIYHILFILFLLQLLRVKSGAVSSQKS